MSIKYLYDRKKIAVTYGEQKYSYADVIKYVNYYSEFLDISKGDRVALMMENRPESIFSFFSIWAKKGIAISLDAGYTVDQLAFVLNDSKPKYIFVSNKVKEVAEKANASNSERKLPNTGMNSSSTTALGLSLIALVGIAVRRKLSK